MSLIMCSIENGSHRPLLIFLSVIHSLVTLLRRSHTDSGQSRRGRRALLTVNGMVVCANVSAGMRSGETARGMRWGWSAVYCLAAVDGSVMVIKIAVWMARLLWCEGRYF